MACEVNDLWRFVKKLLTCSVCGNLFTNPKIIPCSHTFCERCLERNDGSCDGYSVNSRSDSDGCPTCHAHYSDDSTTTDSSVKSLQEVLSPQHMRGQPPAPGNVICTCGKCENQPSTIWCVECQTSLCESCSEEHNSSSTHQTKPIVDFLSNPQPLLISFSSDSDQPGACSSHPQHLLHLICTTCYCLVCLDCILSDHRGHTLTTSDMLLRDDSKVKRDMMISTLIKVLQRISYLDQARDVLDPTQDSPDQLSLDKSKSFPRFIAKYEYRAQTSYDLGFKEGESLYIINRDDGDWWFARAQVSDAEGYVPSNYLVEYGAVDNEE